MEVRNYREKHFERQKVRLDSKIGGRKDYFGGRKNNFGGRKNLEVEKNILEVIKNGAQLKCQKFISNVKRLEFSN